jgi:hypothetical protein
MSSAAFSCSLRSWRVQLLISSRFEFCYYDSLVYTQPISHHLNLSSLRPFQSGLLFGDHGSVEVTGVLLLFDDDDDGSDGGDGRDEDDED